MATHLPIVTVPSGYSRRVERNRPLLTLSIVTPLALRLSMSNLGNTFYSGFWVVDTHFDKTFTARYVRPNGRVRTWKRSMRLRLPWIYGFWRNRSTRYGHFRSSDGLTWDPSSYAPYTLLSEFDPLHPTDPHRTFATPQLSLPIVEA